MCVSPWPHVGRKSFIPSNSLDGDENCDCLCDGGSSGTGCRSDNDCAGPRVGVRTFHSTSDRHSTGPKQQHHTEKRWQPLSFAEKK